MDGAFFVINTENDKDVEEFVKSVNTNAIFEILVTHPWNLGPLCQKRTGCRLQNR